jgi:hypothetical protein
VLGYAPDDLFSDEDFVVILSYIWDGAVGENVYYDRVNLKQQDECREGYQEKEVNCSIWSTIDKSPFLTSYLTLNVYLNLYKA